ncbi:LysR family transcriptional regulator [Halomonas daqingensis]|uniref:LysR family transcriptional regulator n=1 Tax=Billgrantia desiderata TaxID=52021 RepID=A0AAW4YLC3_9GAMM|nr:LysR family transcriptional regulator [Halomonas desiderata]MCE8049822.1 LysR family transcriptional regulator [Halomonas desiderata]
MDASDLKFFETVVRLGSMSRASEELYTVQSNITTRIKALEEELGVTLLLRTNRGVTPTVAGKRLLPYAKQVAAILKDAKLAVLDCGSPAGPLNIGTLETTAAIRLSPVIAEFTASFPDVDLTLRTGTTCELIDQVINHELDGAFVCGPVNHKDVSEKVFFEEELVILAAPEIEDLESYLQRDNLKVIVLRAGCSYRLILESMLARRGVVAFRLLEFGALESIFSTVSSGLGITLLPKRLVSDVLFKYQVSSHSLDDEDGRVKTVFIRRHDAYFSSALVSFLEKVSNESCSGGA